MTGIVDCYILSVPKSGSSSLYSYIKEHPQLYLPKIKELHFFSHKRILSNQNGPGDDNRLRNYCSNLFEYCQQLTPSNRLQKVVELSTSYFYEISQGSTTFFDYIDTNTRIVILVRNPIDRAMSNYMHLKKLGDEKLDLTKALESEKNRINGNWGTFWRYVDQSTYSKGLEVLEANVQKDNLLIISQEELARNPVKLLQELFLFIGVDPHYRPSNLGVIYNKSGRNSNPVADWLQKDSRLRVFIKNILPIRLHNIYRLKRDRYISSVTEDYTISAQDRRLLKSYLEMELSIMNRKYGLGYE